MIRARPATGQTSVGAWRSLAARIVPDDEVGGSNPLAPPISMKSPGLQYEALRDGVSKSMRDCRGRKAEPQRAEPLGLDRLEQRLGELTPLRGIGQRVPAIAQTRQPFRRAAR